MSETPRLRLLRVARPGRQPCWHLADTEAGNSRRGQRFVRQSRRRLAAASNAWRPFAARGDDDAKDQLRLIQRRLAELDADSLRKAVFAPFG